MTAVAEPLVVDAPPPAPAPQTPPHDALAERCVLGAMLHSKDAVDAAAEILADTDFYRPVNAEIYGAILALYSQGEPADAVTVADAMRDSAPFRNAGAGVYLHQCMSEVPSPGSAAYYARIVTERALQRRLIEAGLKVVQLGQGSAAGARDATDAADLAQQLLFDVTGQRSRGDAFRLADLIQPTLDEIEAAGDSEVGSSAVPTGFRDLDRLLGGGFLPGQLVVVAGRPSMGKSTGAVDFLRAAAIRHNLPGVIFSLEMSKTEIVMRLLAAQSRVPLNVLRSGQMSDADWVKLATCMGEIAEAPVFVDDTPNMNLMEIRAKARRLKQRHDIKLIVVDYLQLMSAPKRSENRQQEVAELSRGLKLLAKEIGVPVIAVSQLNRGPEQRTDKRPQLSDLRDSGAVEQDADVVILVHRDDYYDRESPRAGEADFIVAKHRNGPTDTITVAAQLHFARFVDLAM